MNQSSSLSRPDAPHDSHPFAPLPDLQAPNPPMNVCPVPPFSQARSRSPPSPFPTAPTATAAAQQCCHAAGGPQAAQALLAQRPRHPNGPTQHAPSATAHRRPLSAQLRPRKHALEVPRGLPNRPRSHPASWKRCRPLQAVGFGNTTWRWPRSAYSSFVCPTYACVHQRACMTGLTKGPLASRPSSPRLARDYDLSL